MYGLVGADDAHGQGLLHPRDDGRVVVAQEGCAVGEAHIHKLPAFDIVNKRAVPPAHIKWVADGFVGPGRSRDAAGQVALGKLVVFVGGGHRRVL